MSDGLSDEVLDYPALVRQALRQVPRAALQEVALYGLPDPHHFYLSFATRHPGVSLPAQLRELYPDEMTVVLQHQFRDLEVDDEGFSVTLIFGGVPGRISVPFQALTAFVDPGVGFGLRFDGEVLEPSSEGPRPEDTVPLPEDTPKSASRDGAEVVSIDRFRKK